MSDLGDNYGNDSVLKDDSRIPFNSSELNIPLRESVNKDGLDQNDKVELVSELDLNEVIEQLELDEGQIEQVHQEEYNPIDQPYEKLPSLIDNKP